MYIFLISLENAKFYVDFEKFLIFGIDIYGSVLYNGICELLS